MAEETELVWMTVTMADSGYLTTIIISILGLLIILIYWVTPGKAAD